MLHLIKTLVAAAICNSVPLAILVYAGYEGVKLPPIFAIGILLSLTITIVAMSAVINSKPKKAF